MINFAIGIVIGAVFAPFWIKGWEFAKTKFKELTGKKGE